MPGRILVIDRDRDVRTALTRALEGDGYNVDFCDNGNDALERVSSSPADNVRPDAILLDLMMPGGKGRRFLSALRDELKITDIPVLVITSVPGMDHGKALAMGADDVVEKPLDPEEVLNKLALALFRTRGHYVTPSEEIILAEVLDPHGDAGDYTGEGVVVVVDDDRESLERLERVFRSAGYNVVSLPRATDEMIGLSRVLEPTAIVLDLHVPGVGGLTTLQRLRSEADLDHVPILILADDTGSLRRFEDQIAGLAAGVGLKTMSDQELLAFVSAPPRSAWRGDGVL